MESLYFNTSWPGSCATARLPGKLVLFICASIALTFLFGAKPVMASAALEKTIFICNTQAPNNDATCASYSQDKLISMATPRLIAPSQCKTDQTQPECNDSQAISEVRYMVIDAGNAATTLYSLKSNAAGTGVVLNALPLGSEEQQITNSILKLEAMYEKLPEALTFNINRDGTVTNGFGRRMRSFEAANTHNVSTQKPADNPVITGKLAQACPSAIAYAISSKCSAALDTMLDDFNADESSTMREKLESISGARLTDADEAVLMFADGSVLVLALQPGEYLGIALDASKSQISGGATMAMYLDGMDDDNIHGGAGPQPGGEARAIFDSHFKCHSKTELIDFNRHYLVRRVTQPDGSSKLTATEYEGSTVKRGVPPIVCNET